MIRDVMVFTPVLRLEAETVKALMELEWDGALSLVLQRDNLYLTPGPFPGREGEKWRNHLHQYQRGRELFLQGSYEAMLVIESDMIPPRDTLMRLAGLDVDLAYGCYVFRAGKVVNILERYEQPARNIGESLSVRGLWDSARQQGVIDCSGGGLGCILIRRHVLEEVPFEEPKDPGFFDWEWTQRVYDRGYRMVADAAVMCGHVDEDGEVLWPEEWGMTTKAQRAQRRAREDKHGEERRKSGEKSLNHKDAKGTKKSQRR